MLLRAWVRFPSQWIDSYGLREFTWRDGGSANTAALMILAAIVQHSTEPNGVAQLTYNQLEEIANLSRPKIAEGLQVLVNRGLIARSDERRSLYTLCSFNHINAGGWAKFPAKRMYNSSGRISAFQTFRLRSRVELDALKLFFLFIGRRGNDTNAANISYDKIEEYSGIERSRIRAGISLLIENLLVQTEQQPSTSSEHGVAHSYRISGIEPNHHAGTVGRRSL